VSTPIRAGRMPVIFISHGAPTLAADDSEANRFLRGFGERLGRPRAILVVSAHFDAPVATVTAGESPTTIHDFGGFPRALYELRYPAPGDPGLAERVARPLAEAGIDVQRSTNRGFDHGAWVPLLLMYPQADIPVVQLSLDSQRGAGYHFRLGELLAPLRDEGVLIVGSGGVVHNLRELDWSGGNVGPEAWAETFNEWVAAAIARGRYSDIVRYRELGPDAQRNHPTAEHFLPLVFALGAAGDHGDAVRVHHSYSYGNLSMDNYAFGAESAA